ncbi:phosphoribosylanthranilate isomerase [Sulfitobacter sp. HNIBRBA2951]|uniref:phosphoribosylanthranilate isomerase n=1 Tax=Sulfitobacter aquimarinus TaxID=3158557 RepID=UPI0032DF355F
MPADISVKICGLRRPQDVAAVADAGGRYVGFTFFPKSPRSVDIAGAAPLAAAVPVGVCKVALTVNADDAFLDSLTQGVVLDMLQLHGSESVERVAHIKARYGLPVMKAIGVAEAADLDKIDLYSGVADQLLIDAKPPKDADLPGGNGLAFDWQLLAGRVWRSPWMLAGGLTPDNVAEAIQRTNAYQVDVASGVESSPGVKDAGLIDALVRAAVNA